MSKNNNVVEAYARLDTVSLDATTAAATAIGLLQMCADSSYCQTSWFGDKEEFDTRTVAYRIAKDFVWGRDNIEFLRHIGSLAWTTDNEVVRDAAVDLIRWLIYGNGKTGNSEVKSKSEIKLGAYSYIPARCDDVAERIKRIANKAWIKYAWNQVDAKMLRTKSFVDVGSGIGDKVMMAWALGFNDATGIEMNRHTHELARFFVSNAIYLLRGEIGTDIVHQGHNYGRINLINANAMRRSMKPYDFIYMYRPIADGEGLKKLYAHCLKTMSKGAVLFDTGATSELPQTAAEFSDHPESFLSNKYGDWKEICAVKKVGQNKLEIVG